MKIHVIDANPWMFNSGSVELKSYATLLVMQATLNREFIYLHNASNIKYRKLDSMSGLLSWPMSYKNRIMQS